MEATLPRIVILLFCLGSAATASENVRFFSAERGYHSQKSGGAKVKESGFANTTATVSVVMQQAVSRISPYFIGVNLDSVEWRGHWMTLNLTSRSVQNMAKALVPSFLRLGGTMADGTTYLMDQDQAGGEEEAQDGAQSRLQGDLTPFNITAKQWTRIYDFVATVGWDMIFDVNAIKRFPNNHTWNPENFRTLLKYSADHNFTIAGFELGNEYDYYQPTWKVTVTPTQLAHDVVTLGKVLAEYPQFYSAFIIGPEVVHDFSYYVREFLVHGASDIVRAATFHHYYFNGADRNLAHFTDVSLMDSFKDTVEDMTNQTRSADIQMPVWLSETSSSYDRGCVNISDRFVAGFLWLDKLGVAAEMGIQTVMRQDFYGGHYALIDEYNLPNPDFWLTVLFKRIVGGPVFTARSERKDVRVYSACANPQSYAAGGLVVYMLNPNNYTVDFSLPQFHTQPRLLYSLTAGDSHGLLSKFMALNGVKLELVNEELPVLKPVDAPLGVVKAPAYSYTFVVFPKAKASVCLHPE